MIYLGSYVEARFAHRVNLQLLSSTYAVMRYVGASKGIGGSA